MRILGTIYFRPDTLQYLIDNGLWILIFVISLIYGGSEDSDFASFALVFSGLLFILLILSYLSLRRKLFILSEETLVYERGIFNRSADYIELYRVIDFREEQSFLQQLCGLKTVIIFSGDRTTPQLRIPGLHHKEDLIHELRQRVEYNKTRRGVYEITNRY